MNLTVGLDPSRAGCIAAAALVVAALGVFATPSPGPPARDRPSLVLVVIDTLRADRLGTYGYARPTSPNIDRFATGAVVYETAITPAPFTMPAMASMFTGLYPDRTGVFDHSARHRLTDTPSPTLAELARGAGYRTAAVVTNPWLANRAQGFDRGFDRYRTRAAAGEHGRTFTADLVTRSAVDLLDELTGQPEPFLLWVHYLDPHMPYTPSSSARDALGVAQRTSAVIDDFVGNRRSKSEIYFGGDYPGRELARTRDLYDAEVRAVDDGFGRLLEALQRSGRADDTVVIVASDHGESLGEHGLFFAHDHTLYEELVHVALIVREPGKGPARIGAPVSLVDVTPTLCTALALPCPRGLDGRILPSRAGSGRDRTVFAASAPWRKRYATSPHVTVRGTDGRWTMARTRDTKLLRIPRADGVGYERFDLTDDAAETAPSDEADEGLSSALERWRAAMDAGRREPATGTAPLGRDVRDSLRELGYLE